MGLEQTFVKGQNVGVHISEVQGTKAVAPADITITVTADAAVAALALTLDSSADITLRKNQLLTFGAVEVVVTADTAIVTGTPVSVPVDASEGDAGDGISAEILTNATATWDQLYRVLGTAQSDFSISEQTNQLSSTTYDSSSALSWDEVEITSKGWQVARQGRFKPSDYAYQQIFAAALNGKELWFKHVSPDEDGAPAALREGRVKITGYAETNPSDGIIDANWTFSGQGKPETEYL